jgi:hypothetical protein
LARSDILSASEEQHKMKPRLALVIFTALLLTLGLIRFFGHSAAVVAPKAETPKAGDVLSGQTLFEVTEAHYVPNDEDPTYCIFTAVTPREKVTAKSFEKGICPRIGELVRRDDLSDTILWGPTVSVHRSAVITDKWAR